MGQESWETPRRAPAARETSAGCSTPSDARVRARALPGGVDQRPRRAAADRTDGQGTPDRGVGRARRARTAAASVLGPATGCRGRAIRRCISPARRGGTTCSISGGRTRCAGARSATAYRTDGSPAAATPAPCGGRRVPVGPAGVLRRRVLGPRRGRSSCPRSSTACRMAAGHEYDTDVPVLVNGAGVAPGGSESRCRCCASAPTLARGAGGAGTRRRDRTAAVTLSLRR